MIGLCYKDKAGFLWLFLPRRGGNNWQTWRGEQRWLASVTLLTPGKWANSDIYQETIRWTEEELVHSVKTDVLKLGRFASSCKPGCQWDRQQKLTLTDWEKGLLKWSILLVSIIPVGRHVYPGVLKGSCLCSCSGISFFIWKTKRKERSEFFSLSSLQRLMVIFQYLFFFLSELGTQLPKIKTMFPSLLCI